MKSSGAFDDLSRLDGIYDAAFDDSELEGLTTELASAFKARSSLVHWVQKDGSTSVVSHSGYFSADQLALYAQRFAAIDPWMLATTAPEHINRVNDLEQLVSHADFLKSRFYEDYVAAMGDNTSRCLGVRLESAWGTGFIGLQRGSDQSRFEASAIQHLANMAPHLMRMLSIRGRLGDIQSARSDLAAALDLRGEPSWVLRHDGLLLHLNRAAEAELMRADGLIVRNGYVRARADRVQAKFAAALHGAANGKGATAVSIPTSSGSVELSLTSFANQHGQRHVMVIASDHRTTCPSRSQRLKALYGISESECQVAIALANGLSIGEIADARQTSAGTVRFQVKAIANKLGCHRQSQIVAAVLRLPPLSSDGSW